MIVIIFKCNTSLKSNLIDKNRDDRYMKRNKNKNFNLICWANILSAAYTTLYICN